jgi:hypothetical protein
LGADSSVLIRRWRNEYIVSREHHAPEGMRLALDELGTRLPEELASGLAPWCADGGDQVLLIGRLSLSCEVDLHRGADVVTGRWARRFSRTLIDIVAHHPEAIIRYSSRAAYLAQFLQDLAAGIAWDCWHYQPFEGLRALGAGAAIRTVLLEDSGLGRAALWDLPDGAWGALESVLDGADTDRILRGLCEGEAGPLDVDDLSSLLEAWEDLPTLFPSGGSGEVGSLYLMVKALRSGLEPTRSLADWSRLLGTLSVAGTTLEPAMLRSALLSLDITSLHGRFPGIPLAAWEPLRLADEPVRRRLVEAVGGPLRATDIVLGSGPYSTEFAGMAILIPEVDAALTDDWCEPLPQDPVGSRGLAGLLVLATAAGETGAPRLFAEPLWRILFGISPQITWYEVGAWLAPAERCAQASLAHLARRIPGFADSSPAHIRANFLAGRGRARIEGERCTLELTRPPLGALLNLTGISRGNLIWTGPPPFTVVLEYVD